VNSRRYDYLRSADYYLDLFTTDQNEGFIEVILKSETRKKLNEGAIVILPTGWCNQHYVETEPFYYVRKIIQFLLFFFEITGNCFMIFF